MKIFAINMRVRSKKTGREGVIEQGDRRGSPIPSWAPHCVMVRFDGTQDAITVPTTNLDVLETKRRRRTC